MQDVDVAMARLVKHKELDLAKKTWPAKQVLYH